MPESADTRILTEANGDANYLRRYDAASAPANTDLIALEDVAGFGARMVQLTHRADGTAGDGSTYAVNISNRPGARSALVIHQYSDILNTAGLHIDNTATRPSIKVWNTENPVYSPDTVGTGAFLQFRPWQSPDFFHLTNEMVLENKTQYGMTARVPVDGQAVPAFTVDQKQPQVALQVSQAAEGSWASTVNSSGAYGVSVNASSLAAGQALTVDRSGVAGIGEAVRIINRGTGDSIAVRNATTQLAKVASTGEYENMVAGGGIVLKSPNGTRYRITVSDAGTISASAA